MTHERWIDIAASPERVRRAIDLECAHWWDGEAAPKGIDLEPRGVGTRVRMTAADGDTHASADDGQPLFPDAGFALLALRNWVEYGDVGARFDWQHPHRGDVSASVDVRAPRDVVWRVLGEKLDEAWWFELMRAERPVEILRLVEGREIAYPYWLRKPADQPDTVMIWTLEDSGGGTRLTLVHSGFADDVDTEGLKGCWTAHVNWIKFVAEHGPEWEQRVDMPRKPICA